MVKTNYWGHKWHAIYWLLHTVYMAFQCPIMNANVHIKGKYYDIFQENIPKDLIFTLWNIVSFTEKIFNRKNASLDPSYQLHSRKCLWRGHWCTRDPLSCCWCLSNMICIYYYYFIISRNISKDLFVPFLYICGFLHVFLCMCALLEKRKAALLCSWFSKQEPVYESQ